MRSRTPMSTAALPSAASALRPTRSFVGYLLVKAALQVRAATAAALQPLELSPQEFGLLNQVVAQPAMTQAQLGGLLGIDRTTVVAMLDRLMDAGWIVRSPDTHDRRVYRISGTNKGLALHAKALAAVLEVERAFLGRLDVEQSQALVEALALVGDAQELNR